MTQSQLTEIESKAEVLLVHPWNVNRQEICSGPLGKRRQIEKEYNELLLSFQKFVGPEWVLSLIQTANSPELQNEYDVSSTLT